MTRRVPLKRLFRIVNGSTPKSDNPDFWDGEVVWVTPEDLSKISDGKIASSRRMVSEAGYRSCNTTLVPSGSIVLTTRAPIGNLALASASLCTNQGCKSLVPLSDGTVSRFFYYQLLSRQKDLTNLGNGTTFLELSSGDLGRFKIIEPDSTTQEKIARFLDRETAKADALVAKYERLIELLEEKRTALITQAVTKGLDPAVPMKETGDSFLRAVPAHWEVQKLGRCFDFIYRYPTYYNIKYVENGVAEVRGEALQSDGSISRLPDQRFISEDTNARYPRTVLRQGDIVMSVRGTMGKIGLVDKMFHGANITANLLRLSPDQNLLLPTFLKWLMLSQWFFEVLERVSSKTTISTITVPALVRINLPIPPPAEQQKIATAIERETKHIERLKQLTRRAIDLTRERRSALITAAVTGQIDIRTYRSQESRELEGAIV